MTGQDETEVPAGERGKFDDDQYLLEQLRNGNEDAFVVLIDRYASALLKLALVYVKAQSVAEEVVQETWLAVLMGLTTFRGESSLKTWIFRILMNRAKTRAQREIRTQPFSSLEAQETDHSEPAVASDHFLPAEHQRAGHQVSSLYSWQEMPEERLLSQEMLAYLNKGLAALSTSQREIIILRDIEGWTAQETRRLLGISEGNQRVLLHRARAKMHTLLEKYFEDQ